METQTCSEIGQMGEDEAVRYLTNLGFTIKHRNWRSGRYELDIVAEREGVLHVVEVKCRKKQGLTTPEQAISAKKFHALSQGAQRYMEVYALDCELCIDLVAVEYGDVNLLNIRYMGDIRPTQWESV